MKAIYLKARKGKSEIEACLKSMLSKLQAWPQKGKDLPIETVKSAPGSGEAVLFLRKARKRSLSAPESSGLGWFNEGSRSVFSSRKSTEKTLFSVFSIFPCLVAGRVKKVKSDQRDTFCDQKVSISDQKRTFLQLLSGLGWFNEGFRRSLFVTL